MSTGSSTDVKIPVVYVRWEVKTPARDKSINSSDFRFQNSEWYLRFYYGCALPMSGIPKYYLNVYNKGRERSSFIAWVHVEDAGTGRILPQMSQETRSCYSSCPIWSMSVADVKRMSPIDRNYSKLRFLVILKKRDDLTDTDTAENQIECSVLEAAAGQSSTNRSTAVQTNPLSSAVSCLESLSEDLAQLLVQGSHDDVEFQCMGQSTRAHKSIVCSRSPVIASMLARDMVERRTGLVKISDMEPDIFRQFMGYLYSGQLEELTFDTALRLYEAGDKYAVQGLAKRCREFLVEHLSVDNAWEVLVVADCHCDQDLTGRVVDYMVECKVPRTSDRWSAFTDDHPKLAIKVLNRGWEEFLK